MYKRKSLLNFLVIAIMLLTTVLAALFIYSSFYLKNRFILNIVRKTDMASEILTSSVVALLGNGHNARDLGLLRELGAIIGVDEIGIYRLTGDEAFREEGQPARRISPGETDTFKKALFTTNPVGFFDRNKKTYTRYVPLGSDARCTVCHISEKTPLGMLKIRLNAGSDFEFLGYLQWLIRILGLFAVLPMVALVVAVAIIREKNRVYSELKLNASNLEKTYNELKAVRGYLQMILDNSRVVIVTTDTAGRVVEFNTEGERLLGYTKDEIAGKDFTILFEDPREDADFIERWRNRAANRGAVRNREVVFRSKKGRLIYMSLTLSTMVNKEGEVIGAVAIGKDISEQKMLQFKLMQSEKLAGIGTLASGIAHEINNPLAGVLGMAEAIKDEEDVDTIKAYAEDIIRYASNAGEIVKELSAYSRSASSDAASTVDVGAAVESALRMARHSVSFNPIKVVRHLEQGCYIIANPGEIQQVFVNLIINAVHAMGESGTLTIRCWREDGFVKARISDTGHGIPREYINHIYDPFFTTKPVGLGTGLGLYVVYRIVTRYHGGIDVESRPGQGTSFTLRFPVENNVQPIDEESR